MSDTCATCRWFHREQNTKYTYQEQCRRYPPPERGYYGWPNVKPTDFCGEYAPKDPNTQKEA